MHPPGSRAWRHWLMRLRMTWTAACRLSRWRRRMHVVQRIIYVPPSTAALRVIAFGVSTLQQPCAIREPQR